MDTVVFYLFGQWVSVLFSLVPSGSFSTFWTILLFNISHSGHMNIKLLEDFVIQLWLDHVRCVHWEFLLPAKKE